jgi:NAD(P)-dependent dehydrogenase (short-subunit alcohol dehydrogenase family)
VDDTLRYAGLRVIVTGAAGGVGAAATALLVELGAEVHAIDVRRPAARGLASITETDLRDGEQIDSVADRIGGVVNALFHCARPDAHASDVDVVLVHFGALRHLTEHVVPNMIPGSAIAGMAPRATAPADERALVELLATPDLDAVRKWCDENPERIVDARALAARAVAAYTAAQAPALASEHGTRLNSVQVGDEAPAEAAWPLLLLNSPRASLVTGAALLPPR